MSIEKLSTLTWGLVDVFQFHRHVGTALELLPDCRDEVGGEHFLERPAGLHGIGKRRRGLVDALAHRIDFVLDHLPEAKPQGGLEIVVVEHFGGGPDVGKGGPVALGNAVQQLIAPGLALEGAGDVVQHENEAGEGTFALLPGIEHRRHLHPEQLPGRVVVTKFVTGWAALLRRRCCRLSSAWTMRLRSSTV